MTITKIMFSFKHQTLAAKLKSILTLDVSCTTLAEDLFSGKLHDQNFCTNIHIESLQIPVTIQMSTVILLQTIAEFKETND